MNIVNNPTLAGQKVEGTSEVFGEFSQYKVFATHTRLDQVMWFVVNVERQDELGLPLVIRQETTKAAAMGTL